MCCSVEIGAEAEKSGARSITMKMIQGRTKDSINFSQKNEPSDCRLATFSSVSGKVKESLCGIQLRKSEGKEYD